MEIDDLAGTSNTVMIYTSLCMQDAVNMVYITQNGK